MQGKGAEHTRIDNIAPAATAPVPAIACSPVNPHSEWKAQGKSRAARVRGNPYIAFVRTQNRMSDGHAQARSLA